MNKLTLLLLFLTSFSFAQNSYIVDKKGNKIIVRDDATEIILIDKRISYVLEGKTWPKFIKFDDLDYANINGVVAKSFNFNGSKKSQVFFVLASKEGQSLIARTITYTSSSPSRSIDYTTESHNLILIDDNHNILDQIKFNFKHKEIDEQNAQIEKFIKAHFSDCLDLMAYINENKTNLSNLFNNSSFINCK